ncbi:MAG: signal peptidase I [Lachnospiraceae bacterium]|nr:signal peptidase I [Lachnospiraceae bacterium]
MEKKVFNMIKNIVTWSIAAFAACVMVFTIFSVTLLNRDERSLFGYRAFIVLSDSMSATDFEAGDVVLVKEVDPETLSEGDIIAYISQDTTNFGQTITHKIRRKTTDVFGQAGFVTYGTGSNIDDALIVTYPFVRGKYQGRIPKVGLFFQFLKTVPGYIIFVLIPFLVLIIERSCKCIRLLSLYRSERLEKVQKGR